MVEDFDAWAAQGCTGWSFAELLPFFNRLETDLRYGAASYHGDSGPIPIYRAPLSRWGAVDQALGEAALDLGYAVGTRSQRAARARCLAVRDQQPRRRAREHERRVPRAQSRAPEPEDRRRRPRRPRAHRGPARGRRTLPARRHLAGSPCARRAAVCRRGALAGDPAALGDRSAGAPRRARHRDARCAAGRRAAPGPSDGGVRRAAERPCRAAARLPAHQLLRALQLGHRRRRSGRHDDACR